MMNLFYSACVAEERGAVLDNATAARVAQADQQGWKAFIKESESAVQRLVSPLSPDTKKKPNNGASFLRTIQEANARRAAQNGHLQGPVPT